MTTTEITNFLKGVNLMHFSQEYKLPLRTLVRLKAGTTIPRAGTQKLVAAAIAREQRKQAKAEAAQA